MALQAPLSMGFSRQEYWSGLPFPSPQDEHRTEINKASDWYVCPSVLHTVLLKIWVPPFPFLPCFCIPTNCCYEALFLLKKKKSVCIICMKLPRIFQIVGTLGGQAHSCSRCCWCLMRSRGCPVGGHAQPQLLTALWLPLPFSLKGCLWATLTALELDLPHSSQ